MDQSIHDANTNALCLINADNLLNSLPVGLIYQDSQGIITSVNDQAQEILGRGADELMGHSLFDKELNLIKAVESDSPQLENPVTTALETGKAIPNFVVEINHPDKAEPRRLLFVIVPVTLPDEKEPVHVYSQFWDITECRLVDLTSLSRFEKLQSFWETLDLDELEQETAEEFYQKVLDFVVELFPTPDLLGVRLRIGDSTYQVGNLEKSNYFQTGSVRSDGSLFGTVEAHYQEELDQQTIAFQESQLLVNALAERLGLYSYIKRQHDEKKQLQADALNAYDKTIEAWSAALEAQDKETGGHTKRVTDLALELAKEMGFEGQDLDNIRRGALLHDVGKISVPDRILSKPGKLTEEEFAVVKKHPEFTQQWLSQIEALKPALVIPYYHHEKWNGAGYPQGLKGEEIPLEARMFAIVDVWDALIHDQPYRKAMSRQEALDLVLSESGKQFDPNVVKHFYKVLTRGGYLDVPHEIVIQTFNKAQVWANNRLVTDSDWGLKDAKHMFFLFIAHPKGLLKEQVGLKLWPDASQEEMDIRFKNTLYRLRRAVGKDAILLANQGYRFNQTLDYAYDVEIFLTNIERATNAENLEDEVTLLVRAIEIYDGDYLPEIDDDWAIIDRERYRQTYLDALMRLAKIHFEQKKYETALRYCKEALGEDPALEEAHRFVMQIYALTGNMADVVRQYEQCRHIFFDKFGVPPSKQTRDLYQDLINT